MYSKIILMIFLLTKTHSYLIETTPGEEDVCNFQDRRLAESVRLIRSKYNCRVYYVCAFYKQYSLICAEGLYFDQDSNSCNYQEIVKCKLASDDYTLQENSVYLIEQNQEFLNQSNKTDIDLLDFYFNQTNLMANETEEIHLTTHLNEMMFNLTDVNFMNENSTETPTPTNTEILNTTQIQTSTYIATTTEIFADLNNWWHGPTNCIKGFEHKLPHKDNCALYFECTKNGEKIIKSCPYPLQYDEMLNECRFYDLIECGTRKQAKDLCKFLNNNLFN